jgi:hypothetical protein
MNVCTCGNITSNNPQSAYANHIFNNKHEYGPIKPTITLLQSTQKGRHMNVLEKYVIQFFQHNKKTVNEQMQKERNQLFELVYDLKLHTCT